MVQRRISRMIPVGLLLMSLALFGRNWLHGRAPDFAVGLLMGVALALMIAGLVRQRRQSS